MVFDMNFKVESRLRNVMADAKIKSISKLSELSGISRPTIIKIEKGDFDTIQFGILLKICSALECTIDELIKITVVG